MSQAPTPSDRPAGAADSAGRPVRLGIVGVGKIAVSAHLPAIAATRAFALVAAASPHSGVDGIANYRSVEAMLAAEALDAVALCQPPQARYAAARAAIDAGVHVLLEKPPGATLAEVEDLREQARARGVTLFATWHSRFAPGVGAARDWLSSRRVRSARIAWREDVRQWHAGQDWIFEAGGFGVFDPGINALSIATAVLPPFHLRGARLSVPANRQAPIAAVLRGLTGDGAPVDIDVDFRQAGPPRWDIVVETDAGTLALTQGGHALAIDGTAQLLAAGGEYPQLYARFAALIAAGESDVDVAPLRHVADAFMAGERVPVAAFDW